MTAEQFIHENWHTCIRENKEDNDTLLGLPYPYIVPSPAGKFQEMYYWDTFFTCKGLLLSGRQELVKNCCDNMAYMVEKYGFVPNGSRTYYLTRSQPPYLSMMIRDVYDFYEDKEWLAAILPSLKKEYDFWMTRRITPVGLNRHGAEMDKVAKPTNYNTSRIGVDTSDRDVLDVAECILCDCESGWDFNPRMDLHQIEFVYIDLNCNLHVYEKNFAYFSKVLGLGEEDMWEQKAAARVELMNKYLWTDEGYRDYNHVKNEHSKVLSVASFYPLWAGIASKEQAAKMLELLPRLEYDFGIATCEKNDVPGRYQWSYPNGWAPLHYIMIRALDNYGFKEDAIRVAQKYVDTVERNYKATGTLWEKYNVVTGDLTVTNEYEMPVMLGWSAGVYLFAKNYLRSQNK